MLISLEKILINQHEMTLKTYVKKTNYIRYKVRDKEIKLTIPQSVYKNGALSTYKNQMIKSLETKLKDIPIKDSKNFLDREFIEILGIKYKIEKFQLTKNVIDFENKIIFLNQNLDKSNQLKVLKKSLYPFALANLKKRVEQINALTIQGKILEITIKDNKSTWGYCTSHNKLNFSFNLLFQPLWVIDYVIIHELAHLVHKDHSVHFWNLVSKFFPNYKSAKTYLKQHGHSNHI